MARIVTKADLPLLENLARTDSLVRLDSSRTRIPGQTGEFFPVREAAQEAITQITARDN
jgi:hypothetical protein